MVYENILQ